LKLVKEMPREMRKLTVSVSRVRSSPEAGHVATVDRGDDEAEPPDPMTL
jgi:hypothetical protein